MTKTNFCFWLQGFFELSTNVETLNITQIECIRRHLEMTMVADNNTKSEFLSWLKLTLDAITGNSSEIQLRDSLKEVNAILPLIKKMLNAEFKHIIDPKFDNQDQLNAIHSSFGNAVGELYRC